MFIFCSNVSACFLIVNGWNVSINRHFWEMVNFFSQFSLRLVLFFPVILFYLLFVLTFFFKLSLLFMRFDLLLVCLLNVFRLYGNPLTFFVWNYSMKLNVSSLVFSGSTLIISKRSDFADKLSVICCFTNILPKWFDQ